VTLGDNAAWNVLFVDQRCLHTSLSIALVISLIVKPWVYSRKYQECHLLKMAPLPSYRYLSRSVSYDMHNRTLQMSIWREGCDGDEVDSQIWGSGSSVDLIGDVLRMYE